MKHREIRAAVLSALKENISERVSWFDGRPVFIDEQELPAVAVYLTDASAADEFVDEGNHGRRHCILRFFSGQKNRTRHWICGWKKKFFLRWRQFPGSVHYC